MKQISDCRSLKDLGSINNDGLRPGSALVNELTSLTKDRNFDFELREPLIRLLLESYLRVFSGATELIDKRKIEKVILFNGRFLHERAVWDAANDRRINVDLFETTRDRFHLRDFGFHDRVKNQEEMLKLWNGTRHEKSEKIEIGSRYYKVLRSKQNEFFINAEDVFEINKPYFVYFSNSDDEVIGFWETWNQALGNQIESVKNLQTLFDQMNNVTLIIKLHPNLKSKSLSQRQEWATVKNTANSIVLGPESNISSYDLLDSCLGSITFGTTLGLESAYVKKPSLLLADAAYDLLKVADKAKSWEEVHSWLLNGHRLSDRQLALRQERSCIRGYFLEMGGYEFTYSILFEVAWGAWEVREFDGIKIYRPKLLMLWTKFISKIRFIRVKRLL